MHFQLPFINKHPLLYIYGNTYRTFSDLDINTIKYTSQRRAPRLKIAAVAARKTTKTLMSWRL
jgi:hypothetical protein